MSTMKLFCACAVVLLSQSFGMAQTTQTERQIRTPEAEYLTWEDDRTLMVFLDQASDRSIVAQQVIDSAINNTAMPIEVRCDGLRIAGHVFYQDGDFPVARTAFSALASLSIDDHFKSDAYRMVAQCYGAEGASQEELYNFELALQHNLAANTGQPGFMTNVLLNNACTVAGQLKNYAKLLELANEGLGLYYDPSNPSKLGAQYLHYSALANLKLGNTQDSEFQYTTLLDEFPKYGLDDKLAGLRPNLLIEQAEAKGWIWDSCNLELMKLAIEIVQDERYLLMPSRIYIAHNLADCMARGQMVMRAIQLREGVIHQVEDALDTLDPENAEEQVLARSLRSAQLLLKYDQGTTYLNVVRDSTVAAAIFVDIVDNYPDANRMITELAQQALDNM